VSYVVNGGPRAVADATRERVEAAIRELGYRKNPLAGGLVAGRTNLLGLLVPDSSNAFFSELSRDFELEAHKRGFLTLLGNTNYDSGTEMEYLQAFADLRAAGTVVASIGPELHVDPEPPRVYVHSQPAGSRGASIHLADRRGAVTVVEHLLSHGYGRVDCITGPGEQGPAAERVLGWQEALSASASSQVHTVSFDRMTARGQLVTLLTELQGQSTPPRALFATTDELALATIDALTWLGLTVPGDVAVAGFDGIRDALHGRPQVTTMRAPIRELAHHALDAIAAWNEWGKDCNEVLEPRLVLGTTCGCPPQSADSLDGDVIG
jgi:LacI family transcriptional regulator